MGSKINRGPGLPKGQARTARAYWPVSGVCGGVSQQFAGSPSRQQSKIAAAASHSSLRTGMRH